MAKQKQQSSPASMEEIQKHPEFKVAVETAVQDFMQRLAARRTDDQPQRVSNDDSSWAQGLAMAIAEVTST